MTIDTSAMHMDDIINVRDIIERIEELESEIEAYAEKMDDWQANADNQEELETLTAILEDLKGYGGDEQWRGDWYPVTLIRESYFTDYAKEMVCDCYDLKLPPFVHVDWEATAREVKMDYSTVEIDGVTLFYR